MTRLYVRRAPDTLGPGTNWRIQAVCADLPDADLMFPAPSDRVGMEAARQVCTSCPVRSDCLKDAMDDEGGKVKDNRFGVRAGLSPSQRYGLYTARRKAERQADAA